MRGRPPGRVGVQQKLLTGNEQYISSPCNLGIIQLTPHEVANVLLHPLWRVVGSCSVHSHLIRLGFIPSLQLGAECELSMGSMWSPSLNLYQGLIRFLQSWRWLIPPSQE